MLPLPNKFGDLKRDSAIKASFIALAALSVVASYVYILGRYGKEN